MDELGVREVAELLQVPRSTAYRWMTKGLRGEPIPSVKRGNDWKARRGDVLQWAARFNIELWSQEP